jgi:hypothetical protein
LFRLFLRIISYCIAAILSFNAGKRLSLTPATLKLRTGDAYTMKVSQLCKMIEDSIHGGKYPLQTEHKPFANLFQVINRSNSDDDLKSSTEIKIEVRIQGLYIMGNYVPNIEHLPGIIEADVLDYFKILCRRLERIKDNNNANNAKSTTISIEKFNRYAE